MIGLLAMLSGTAWAGDAPVVALPPVRTSVVVHLDASQFGFVPKGPERPAVGPSAVAAGPYGAALVDPVDQRLLLVESGAVVSVPLPVVPDAVAAGPDGRWHVLVGRSVWTLGADGAKQRELALPDLVPTSVTLAVVDGWVVANDAFGNHRPLFGVDGSEWTGGAMVEPTRRVRKVAGGIEVDGRLFPVAGQRASGQLVGDWLITESASTGASGKIEVQRWGTHLVTGARIQIPTRGRRWVPTDDLDVDPSGALWILSPTNDGLDLVKVQP